MSNHDRFNEYAAYALSRLFEEHPDGVILIPSRIVHGMGQHVIKENVGLCQRSIAWLHDNGYFLANYGTYLEAGFAERSFRDSRLTTLGFSSLNVKVDFRGTQEKIGHALLEQFKEGASEARSALLGEFLGSAFAAFQRGMTG